jgi:hypothetical protein
MQLLSYFSHKLHFSLHLKHSKEFSFLMKYPNGHIFYYILI